jgi:hypothetical protein
MTFHSKTTEALATELEEFRKEYKKLGYKVSRKYDQWQKSAKESNKENAKGIVWLINNPDTPAQYEGMRAWLTREFGGEYKGVNAGGYHSDINQQAFSFNLSYEDERNLKFDINIKKFLDLALKHLEPNYGDVVSFSYGTGEYSGIHTLGWDTVKEKWMTFKTVYSLTRDEIYWDSFDEALDYAWSLALAIDD